MPRRSRKKSQSDPIAQIAKLLPKRLKARFVLFANLCLILCGVIWFAFQPATRKREVMTIVGNYCDANRRISLGELVYDIFSLYYGVPTVPCDYKPGDAPVFGGLPRRTDGTTLTILPNHGYWVGYDEARRNPAWAAYKLMHVKKPKTEGERPSQFLTDDRTVAKVASDEYTGSGFDRGHMAPNHAIAQCYGREAQLETFLMSNITPQRHAVNAGNWKALETREADSYPDRFDAIWVLAGPVFSSPAPRKLPGGIPVPDAFFKIHVDQREGGIRTQAFLFRHKGDGKEPLETLMVSIRELEKLTGLDFFPELSKETQQKLEQDKATSLW